MNCGDNHNHIDNCARAKDEEYQAYQDLCAKPDGCG
jgi:hypothetical protein